MSIPIGLWAASASLLPNLPAAVRPASCAAADYFYYDVIFHAKAPDRQRLSPNEGSGPPKSCER
jgi:hypothetical protein